MNPNSNNSVVYLHVLQMSNHLKSIDASCNQLLIRGHMVYLDGVIILRTVWIDSEIYLVGLRIL